MKARVINFNCSSHNSTFWKCYPHKALWMQHLVDFMQFRNMSLGTHRSVAQFKTQFFITTGCTTSDSLLWLFFSLAKWFKCIQMFSITGPFSFYRTFVYVFAFISSVKSLGKKKKSWLASRSHSTILKFKFAPWFFLFSWSDVRFWDRDVYV